MEVKSEKHINENGSYITTTETTVTPEDGFVQETDLYGANVHHRRKYVKGNTYVKSFATNDPRVTRPFAYGVCGIFILIGIGLCMSDSFFHMVMGIIFITMSIMCVTKAKKDIDKIADELKKGKK